MFCGNCGLAVTGKYCTHCGEAVTAQPLEAAIPQPDPAEVPALATMRQPAIRSVAPAVAVRPSSAQAAPPFRHGNALTWPFHQPGWPKSLWIPILWWLPLAGFPTLLGFGWAVDALGRRGNDKREMLPPSRDLGKMLKYGLAIVLMWWCISSCHRTFWRGCSRSPGGRTWCKSLT